MKIAIASDHAGFELKEKLKPYFAQNNIEYTDLGTYSTDSVDYPDYGEKLGLAVTHEPYDFGIGICGTGIGIGIAANKVNGVRAALIYDDNTATLAKMHNNANIITFGGRTTSLEQAISMINAFIDAKFEERHQKRLDKIKGIEAKQNG